MEQIPTLCGPQDQELRNPDIQYYTFNVMIYNIHLFPHLFFVSAIWMDNPIVREMGGTQMEKRQRGESMGLKKTVRLSARSAYISIHYQVGKL